MTQLAARISLCLIFVSSCSPDNRKGGSVTLSQEIIALERSALDRWITFDPQGYLDLGAPELTYFDPYRDKRVDGLQALKALLEPCQATHGHNHGATLRDDRSQGSTIRRCGALDIQSHELRQAIGRSGERACPVEFERDVRAGWKNVEACPQPLVVHETGP